MPLYMAERLLILSMYELYCGDATDKQIKLRSLFTLCLTHLSQIFIESISEDGNCNNSLNRVISHINTIINSHPDRNISLNDLKDIACLSKSQLIRSFKKEFFMTPLEYILRQRIKIACKLLVNSTLNIGEIAYISGFTDSNYFSRQFKQRVGMSPREFQKNHAE